MWYLSFSDWLILLSIILSRSLHVVSKGSFHLMALSFSRVCIQAEEGEMCRKPIHFFTAQECPKSLQLIFDWVPCGCLLCAPSWEWLLPLPPPSLGGVLLVCLDTPCLVSCGRHESSETPSL
uniref:Secreted protein n=1 Tax=Molossus molossus TaxID=27622 RepID=A0A7J8HHL3_MOLMO|nr:hypothetical protein HJG59_010949 [Molossus molossus]